MRRNALSNLLLIVLLTSLLLAGCASATPQPTPTSTPQPTQTPAPTPIALDDGMGHTVSLKEPAQRIVSLAPSNTEVLFAIGAGSQVVGRDSFSDYPEQAKQVTDIGGGLGELSAESVLALKPDLVLAADLTPPEQIKALQDVGLTIFQLPNPTDIEGMYANLRVVAKLSGHEAETEQLINQLKARVAAVEEKVVTVKERPLVFYELDATDPNAPWTAGSGTFIDTLITMSGGTNLGNVLKDAWAQISLEELVTQNPEFILLGDYTWGGVTPEDVSARSGWDSLTAVKDGKVLPFDDNLVSRPGPRMVDGLEAMAKLLHPDLFP